MTPQAYAATHFDDFVAELIDLLKIPSISTQAERKADIRRAAEWLRGQLDHLGFAARIYDTPGHPIVYGEWLHAGPGAPTLLVYGHYDVQPPDPLALWHTPPFAPTIRDGNLYARGASDDKGQTFVHLKAAQALLETEGRLPLNVKVIIEGEEENGSASILTFVKEHADLLAADAVVISDSHVKSLEQPTIVYALRGMCYMELEVSGPASDLHSGIYGGVVHNPAQALCEMIAGLHDANGTITVPGFYDTVRPLSDEERAAMAAVPFTVDELRAETGVPAPWGEAEYALHERLGARPTLEVNGLIGGYTEPGAKTVIPSKVLAKVSCRLVADQDPHAIYALFKRHIAAITPPTVRSEVRLLHTGQPALMERDSPAIAAAVAAYEAGWGKKAAFMREGGTIPIVSHFQQAIGAPVVLMGFGLPDDNLHAPNEKFSLDCFRRGIATTISFYRQLADKLGGRG